MDLNHVLRKFFKEMQVLKIEVAVVYLQGNKSYDAIYGINLLHFCFRQGAQGVTMSVRSSGPSLSRALILYLLATDSSG